MAARIGRARRPVLLAAGRGSLPLRLGGQADARLAGRCRSLAPLTVLRRLLASSIRPSVIPRPDLIVLIRLDIGPPQIMVLLRQSGAHETRYP